MYKLQLLDSAIKDMENIAYYIRYNLKNKSASLNLIQSFMESIDKILLFPYSNP